MTNQENGVDLKSAAVTEEKKLFIETYGCQMNVADSEVVASIMKMDGYAVTDKIEDADAIFVNTCSVRDNAEQKIYGRLQYFQSLKRKKKSLVIGVLGCMAERVKEELIEVHHADLVVGFLYGPAEPGGGGRARRKGDQCRTFHAGNLQRCDPFEIGRRAYFGLCLHHARM